ncbi:MAG: GntP family permease [Fusobacteriaceae bacterium]|jgi:H+/gluconate symporter-like permease|nr:GntP family permease [Fusobacteriaceae bacterium]
MGILVLFLALVLFGVLAFKQLSALLLAPIVSIFVLVCAFLLSDANIPAAILAESASAKPGILSGLQLLFMKGASAYVKNYFLVFFVGALFGAVYQFTGAAESIAIFMSGLTKDKYVAPIIMCITGVLTFGGVSGFVVFFVIYPIALEMFKRANLSRRLLPAAISAGTWTWSMTAPWSPSIQNVIAMKSLGTPAEAAPISSFITTVVEFLLIFVFLEYRARKFTKRGLLFEDKTLTNQLTAEEMAVSTKGKDLPSPVISFIPIILILGSFNGPRNVPGFSIFSQKVEAAVMLGVVVAVALMYKRIGNGVKGWLKVFNKGAADSGVAILNTGIVVGFGTIAQNTQGFKDLVGGLEKMSVSPMVFVMITVAVSAGACGSASGGMAVAFNALTSKFLELGIKLEYVHRIGAIAAGTLDTLPHQGAQITLLGICKMTHKEAYYDIMVTQIIIPFIALAVFIPLASTGMM